MIEKKKVLIILTVILFIFLVIPVTIFKKILTQYFGFINSWVELPTNTIKHRIISKIPQEHSSSMGDLKLPEIKFVKFSVNIKAQKVLLKGDFNKWKGDIKLEKKNNNKWEIEIPLALGKYRYIFIVDDKEILDPLNPDVDYYGEKKVSLIEVK